MGYEAEVKARDQQRIVTLDIKRSVQAAVSAYRDEFRQIVGSEPIIETQPDGHSFVIATYGGGDYVLLGAFSLQQLPGCCGAVVLYHASTVTKFQRRGLGRLFLRVRQSAAVLAGYSWAICTTLKSNKGEISLLTAEGWGKLHEFNNKRTNNDLVVFTKQL